MTFKEYLEIASNGPPPSFEPFAWRDALTKKKPVDLAKGGDDLGLQQGIPIKLGQDAHNVFQKYWRGPEDPLYTLLSRGESVHATPQEIARLKQIASQIIKISQDPQEVQIAHNVLNKMPLP